MDVILNSNNAAALRSGTATLARTAKLVRLLIHKQTHVVIQLNATTTSTMINVKVPAIDVLIADLVNHQVKIEGVVLTTFSQFNAVADQSIEMVNVKLAQQVRSQITTDKIVFNHLHAKIIKYKET